MKLNTLMALTVTLYCVSATAFYVGNNGTTAEKVTAYYGQGQSHTLENTLQPGTGVSFDAYHMFNGQEEMLSSVRAGDKLHETFHA